MLCRGEIEDLPNALPVCVACGLAGGTGSWGVEARGLQMTLLEREGALKQLKKSSQEFASGLQKEHFCDYLCGFLLRPRHTVYCQGRVVTDSRKEYPMCQSPG